MPAPAMTTMITTMIAAIAVEIAGDLLWRPNFIQFLAGLLTVLKRAHAGSSVRVKLKGFQSLLAMHVDSA
jgi:hypothetical protein